MGRMGIRTTDLESTSPRCDYIKTIFHFNREGLGEGGPSDAGDSI